ncbi:surfeit locus protein 1-like [Strongylocentrotus purpuratus]|uniref:SURF1-like protein n=1 Tax=Strongylocentrotus purpuratus TaxID=7668 RepID=A0A7M7PRD0_STRPU|nr:surfeit locus protein 1-like [Strongylocentrotus purpuratus]
MMNRFRVRGMNSATRTYLFQRMLVLKNVLSQKPPLGQRLSSTQANEEGGSSLMSNLLLVIPVAAFGLGTWQVQRRKWKLGLIKDLQERSNAPPVPLPLEASELNELEYKKVRVRGSFDHSREMYILPRSLLQADEGGHSGSMMAGGQTGVHVVTPFHCSDLGVDILVNRGWVTRKSQDPQKRLSGQQTGEVDLVGCVRLTEKRAQFMPNNDEVKNRWHYRDLEAMSRVAKTLPIMIDADRGSTVPGGPVGGQTRISLRNEHMQYILTWYSLSLFTSLMWYYGVYKKRMVPPRI